MGSDIIIELINDGILEDVLEFTIIFGQTIYKRLSKFLLKINSNSLDEITDIYELKVVLNYLENFILNKENLFRIIVRNDFNFLKRPLFQEIMTLLFDVRIIFKNFQPS